MAVVICGCMYGILEEPFFYRSIRYQMFEVERVSVFSMKEVLFS